MVIFFSFLGEATLNMMCTEKEARFFSWGDNNLEDDSSHGSPQLVWTKDGFRG